MIDVTTRKNPNKGDPPERKNLNKNSANLENIASKAIIERIIDTFPNVEFPSRSIKKEGYIPQV